MQVLSVPNSTLAIFEVAWRRQSFERGFDPTDHMVGVRGDEIGLLQPIATPSFLSKHSSLRVGLVDDSDESAASGDHLFTTILLNRIMQQGW